MTTPTKPVEVVLYNPTWPQMFEEEAALIQQSLGENCLAVHHIGSTSVPGLAAKPIIDIVPVVRDIAQVDQTTEKMETLGYAAKGEFGMLFRRFFQKNMPQAAYNVHVFEEGNSEIDRHLKFRDWMRNHSEDRDAYAALKQTLAEKFSQNMLGYCSGKDAFVAAIDVKAGAKGLRIVEALTDREWAAAKSFRQREFFDKASIDDPYTWTFDHPDHVHLILYKGAAIVGYAHIQLWPESRAAIRIIVIDESVRNQGLGEHFLTQCERWLRTQGRISLHTESSPAAKRFYDKQGYTLIPFNDPDGYEGGPEDIPMGKRLVRQ